MLGRRGRRRRAESRGSGVWAGGGVRGREGGWAQGCALGAPPPLTSLNGSAAGGPGAGGGEVTGRCQLRTPCCFQLKSRDRSKHRSAEAL